VEKTVGLVLLTFLTVCLSIVVGYQLISTFLSRDRERVRQRLVDEFGPAQNAAPTSPLYKNLDQLNLEGTGSAGSDAAASKERAARRQPMDRLTAWLNRSGLAWSPTILFASMAGLAAAAALPAGWFAGRIAASIAAILAALVPLVYVQWKSKARQDSYLKQLPNAFDLMARVIRAGQSVPQALQAVADAFEGPLASGFQACLQKQNLGMRPEAAFQTMADASGIVEMRIFAMAMVIQRQTGGNLSEVLERLSGLVRARLKLRQQIRTLTAEGRLQGATLVVLPFLVFVVLLFVNRAYVEVLFQHRSLLLGTLVSMGIGVLWIRKIVNIDN
jgi:tight adherence protein B